MDRARGVGPGRTWAGAVLAVLGLAALTALLVPARDSVALASVVLLYLALVVAAAALGGVWPALGAAVASDLLVNYFFVPPYHTLTVESGDHAITLVVFVAVAVTVSVAVDLAARQRAAAARSGVESALLARISAEPVRQGSAATLLEQVRATLRMDGAALVEDGRVVASAGTRPGAQPSLSVDAGDGLRLVVDGPDVFAPDRRFLARLAGAAARTLQAERLAEQAAHARELGPSDTPGGGLTMTVTLPVASS